MGGTRGRSGGSRRALTPGGRRPRRAWWRERDNTAPRRARIGPARGKSMGERTARDDELARVSGHLPGRANAFK
ncbi:hypothetical protein IBTHAUMO2_830016 [Nitrosopumilaceae archaeon]|nr:hypothetical protein IBTHAUMO2_830016 [Nitrosopumilaceae archaeon]